MSADMELYEQLRRRDEWMRGIAREEIRAHGELVGAWWHTEADSAERAAAEDALAAFFQLGDDGVDGLPDPLDVRLGGGDGRVHADDAAGFGAADLGADGGDAVGEGLVHEGSSRVGASAVAPADASEPTLEAAPGTHTASRGVSGAPSGALLGGVGAALLAFVVGRFGLLPDSVVIGACAGVAVVALLQMTRRRT